MLPHATDGQTGAPPRALPKLSASNRRTLDAMFHHPTAHNLAWSDVLGLIGEVGAVREKTGNEFVFEVEGRRLVVRKPHGKDVPGDDVIDIRHFLTQADWSPEGPSQPATQPASRSDLLIVVDHHGARIFHVDVAADDPSADVIRPYDPHHFLHHLVHKGQSGERGQRAPEEPAYYEAIAAAVAHGGKIVVAGHGVGKSSAALHLTAYLHDHHPKTYQRIVRDIVTDLSAITLPQLLDLARSALRA